MTGWSWKLGRVAGIETQTGADTPVAAAMTPHFDSAEPSEMLEGAVQRLQASGCPALPVVRDRELVGVLTMENVGEFHDGSLGAAHEHRSAHAGRLSASAERGARLTSSLSGR